MTKYQRVLVLQMTRSELIREYYSVYNDRRNQYFRYIVHRLIEHRSYA